MNTLINTVKNTAMILVNVLRTILYNLLWFIPAVLELKNPRWATYITMLLFVGLVFIPITAIVLMFAYFAESVSIQTAWNVMWPLCIIFYSFGWAMFQIFPCWDNSDPIVR